MRVSKTTGLFLVTVLATISFGLIDELVVLEKGSEFFSVLSLLGTFGSIISFFVALAATYKSDTGEQK